jgi:putative Mg2+ transporter-C (MgtC) family protein
MACGAGLYFPAIFATIVVLVVLELVRVLEYRGNLKLYSSTYEVRGFDVEKLTVAILHVMDRENRHMDALENDPVGELQRLSFSISATHRLHRRLLNELKAAPGIDDVRAFRDPEDE